MLFHEKNAFDKANTTLKLRVTQIALNICESINLNDVNLHYFYVGVTNDLPLRLQQHDKEFRSHLVYSFDFKDRELVKALEAYFVNRYAFKGNTGGGTDDSTILYVLRKY